MKTEPSYKNLTPMQRLYLLAARKECLEFRNQQTRMIPPFVKTRSNVVQPSAIDALMNKNLIHYHAMPDESAKWLLTSTGRQVAADLLRGNVPE